MTGGVRPVPRDLRRRLRRPGHALPNASIGTVPILWYNADVEALGIDVRADALLDEIARLGYEGTQLGSDFAEGAELRDDLSRRGLRLAEVYAALPATDAGLAGDALAIGRERLRLLHAGEGDVLCVAIDGTPERDAFAGRATDQAAPRFSESGWDDLAEVLGRLAAETVAVGHRLAFHPHAGTFVETPTEIERLVAITDPTTVGICLDVGHHLVGGGDPVEALTALGDRVTHVHLKDVDAAALGRLSDGGLGGLDAAVRDGLFTELGVGALDLLGVVRVLADRGYGGWLMVEQDRSWEPPSEAAAIGRRVLAGALAVVGLERARGAS